ncbi:hypothetical protein M408DRAFT_330159 [Serendipita vermifera MAFF 305830]|uniref:Uncharacterized protein n=1 Tax=Serendipita vermifera MAFF 305830 TaxID=933852 RepID=A0A0C3B710_SERVB|nr:hypothetical protein M408DRAFT_330159 [Serendipita vermifera MAFF 305830]
MAGLWTRYMESTSGTKPTIVSQIIQASPTSITAEDRKGLVQNLLDDIESNSFQKQDVPKALLAIKTLARMPEGSTVLVKQSNLKALYKLASPSNPAAVSSETLRCVANALLLVESGRDGWVNIEGGQLCLQYLCDPKTNEEFCFLNARILFLSTVKQSAFLKGIAEDKKQLESTADRCEALLDSITAGKPFARDALTDVLKFIFNLFLQYPRMVDAEAGTSGGSGKVMGEQWSSRFDPFIAPLTRVLVGLPVAKPPLAAPLTHVIHALLNIPVAPYTNIWFPSGSPSSSPTVRHSTIDMSTLKGKLKKQRSEADKDKDKEYKPPSSSFADPFQRAMSLLSSQRRSFGSSPRPDPPRRSMGSAPSVSATDSPSRSSANSQVPSPTRARSSSPLPHSSEKGTNASASSSSTSSSATKYHIVHHACALLDSTLEIYWPGTTEADSPDVRAAAKRENVVLDEVITPLVVLLARLGADPGARAEMRRWILPEDLDRKDPLEGRGDVLGRCMRLMSCVYFPRLKDAIGEWFYMLAGEDGSTLSALIGYGNAAGFLFNKGILSAPPPPPASSSASGSSSIPVPENINPITGTINREMEDDGPEMTEEEKEREAEKLFVLFDRLEKSGMVENPVRKAIQEGKLSMGPFGP